MVVMMMVTVTPMVTMMSSLRLYDNRFPVLSGLVVRRIGRRVVLCQ